MRCDNCCADWKENNHHRDTEATKALCDLCASVVNMTFPSKRDAWIIAVMAALDVALLLAVVRERSIVMGVFLILGIVFFTSLLATNYTIRGDVLLIRSGPFSWRVRIADIVSVRETNNPGSSPALSLDRLEITYMVKGEKREILVSPAEKRRFIDVLRAANPRIA